MFKMEAVLCELEKLKVDRILRLTTRLVLEAADIVKEMRKNQGPGFASIKSEPGGWDMVTDADCASEYHIVCGLLNDPAMARAKVLAEEQDEKMVQNHKSQLAITEDYEQLPAIEFFVGVDGIDGSANFYFGKSGYGIQVFFLRFGKEFGSVIYCPEINGGLLVVSEVGVGVFCFEAGNSVPYAGNLRQPEVLGKKKQGLLLGDSTVIQREYAAIVYALTQECFTESCISSAVMFANLLSGKVNLIFHRPRPSYDCGPGFVGIKALENQYDITVAFFRITQENKIEWLPGADWGDETGWLAGCSDLVEKYKSVVEQNFGLEYTFAQPKSLTAGA